MPTKNFFLSQLLAPTRSHYPSMTGHVIKLSPFPSLIPSTGHIVKLPPLSPSLKPLSGMMLNCNTLWTYSGSHPYVILEPKPFGPLGHCSHLGHLGHLG